LYTHVHIVYTDLPANACVMVLCHQFESRIYTIT